MKLCSYLALLFMGTCSAGDLTLYVGTKSSIYTVDFSTETGAFAEAQEAHAAPTSSFLAFSKDQKHLYSTFSLTNPETNKKTGAVASYSLSGNTTLKKTSESASGGRGTCYVSLDMTGKCLLSADYGSGHLSSYLLSDDGQITKRVSTITLEGSSINPQRQKGPHAHSIYISPDNKHVYAADLGSDKVLCYALDSTTAELTPLPSASTPPGSGPRHIAIHPDGQRLFVLNELTCTVSTFARDAQTGSLKLLSTIDVLQGETKGMTCSEIRLSPDNKHLYTGNRDITFKKRDSLSHLTITEDASEAPVLKQVLTLPISIPRNFNLTPKGKWIIAGGQYSNNLLAIERNTETGTLKITDHLIEVPSPQCILIKAD